MYTSYTFGSKNSFCRSRKTHPGPVVHLSDNPLDASKVRSTGSQPNRKLALVLFF